MNNILREAYPLIHEYLHFMERTDDSDYVRAYSERDNLLRANIETLPRGYCYLNSRLHDSWVIGCERTDRNFVLRVNDFSAHCFCDAVNSLKGKRVAHKRVVLPVELVFSNLRRMSLCQVNSNGKLLQLNVDRYLRKLWVFLYDDVRSLGKTDIALGMIFFTKQVIKKSRELLLEIEAECLHVQEFQRAAFAEICGEESLDLFDLYRQEREKGACFDFSSSVDFLKARGFPESG